MQTPLTQSPDPSVKSTNPSSRTLLVFGGVQVCFAVACAVVWWSQPAVADFSRREPALVNEPAAVGPLFDEPSVVSDEQLARVLEKLRPRFGQGKPKINYVDHALRCWGAEVEFADAQYLSGNELRRLLTDHEAFRAAWGETTRPLLIPKDHGVAVRTQQGSATASHVDHTLASLAECGTPLNYPIRLAGESATLRDILQQAIATFEINQVEYEWTVMALALYAADARPWFTAEGDQVDFDRLTRRIMRQRYGQGVCYGNHRLYSLTILLRLDAEKHLLSPSARGEVVHHLKEATRRLVAHQHAEGYWDRNWYDLKVEAREDDDTLGGPLGRRILATGHALEWWGMVPQDLRGELVPERDVLERAAQWLVTQIDAMDAKAIDDNFTFLSHAGRALALWRGTIPAAVPDPHQPAAPAKSTGA